MKRVAIKAYRKIENKLEFLREYPSVYQAAKDLNIDGPEIWQVLSGRGKTARGYTFTRV